MLLVGGETATKATNTDLVLMQIVHEYQIFFPRNPGSFDLDQFPSVNTVTVIRKLDVSDKFRNAKEVDF